MPFLVVFKSRAACSTPAVVSFGPLSFPSCFSSSRTIAARFSRATESTDCLRSSCLRSRSSTAVSSAAMTVLSLCMYKWMSKCHAAINAPEFGDRGTTDSDASRQMEHCTSHHRRTEAHKPGSLGGSLAGRRSDLVIHHSTNHPAHQAGDEVRSRKSLSCTDYLATPPPADGGGVAARGGPPPPPPTPAVVGRGGAPPFFFFVGGG